MFTWTPSRYIAWYISSYSDPNPSSCQKLAGPAETIKDEMVTQSVKTSRIHIIWKKASTTECL